MKKLHLVVLMGLFALSATLLPGCKSSSKKEETPSPTPQIVVTVDACKQYFDLMECALNTQEEDHQDYMEILKADVTSQPEDQQQAYCAEQRDYLLQRAEEYANLGCPMK